MRRGGSEPCLSRAGTVVRHVEEVDEEPDPVFVEQVRQALRECLAEVAAGPLDFQGRRQLETWTASMVSAGADLAAIAGAADRTDHPALLLTRLGMVTSLLADLTEQTAQLRAVLTCRGRDASPRKSLHRVPPGMPES